MAGWEWGLGVALGLIVAGNLAFYMVRVGPLLAAQAGQAERLLTLQRRIRDLKAQGQILEAQVKALENVETFRTGLPPRSGVVRVSGELHRLAAASGVTVPGVGYQPEPMKDADLLRVKMTLTVEGPYANVRRFLHEVETRRRYLVVERMGLADQRSAMKGGQVAMQLTLAGYFR
jgi:Tfp pilus assembly protein PilO